MADKSFERQELMHFNIAGIDYVVYEDDISELNDDGTLGFCDYVNQRIVVQHDLPPQRKAQVIVHELVHALLSEAGYDEQSEEVVNRLGIAMMPFLVNGDFGGLKSMAKGNERGV